MTVKKIAFIGLGIMGRPMTLNLMKAGFELHIWARHPEKVKGLIEAGAHWHDSAAEAASVVDAVITMVGNPADVEEVYCGEKGLLKAARPGTYLIDMTTSSPELAVKLFEEGKARGLSTLDAPVTGGESGAQNATLAIFVGGEKDAFETCRPVLDAMGTCVSLMGPAGCGQHSKMANQILLAGALTGVCEALTYAERAGLDLKTLFPLLCSGVASSRQLEIFGPKIMAGDDTPSFFIKYLAKDLRIGVKEAQARGLDLSSAKNTLASLDELTARGMGELGTQALVHHYKG